MQPTKKKPRAVQPKPHAVEPDHDASLPLEERELAACLRAFETAGTVTALQDALLICAEQGRPLPRWLTIGLLKTLDAGAAPSERDVVDYVRFLAVCEGRDLGLTWPRAYEYAAASLSPIDAAKGGDDTMAKAYKLVARGLRETPGRYFIARGETATLAYQPTPEHAEEVLREFLK